MPTSLDLSASLPPARSGWRDSVVASVRENSPIYVLVVLYVIAADSLSAWVGTPHRSLDRIGSSYEGYIAICTVMLAFAFIVWIVHLSLVRKISIQTREAWRRTGTEFLGRERLLLSLPILAIWPVLAQAFSQVKTLIPAIHPYSFDPVLHQLDRILHFGHDPWTLLQPILGYPVVTWAIDFLYALWLFVIYFALLQQITSTRDHRLRAQFLIASVLAWALLGSVGGILLSSAGPCYYALVVGGPDPYALQMAYLHETVQGAVVFGKEINLLALATQDMLWNLYQENGFGFGHGISAAPSMHVASTWLVARMAQCCGRRAAIAGWSFFGIILVGSIHLGWHYAVDGYISIIAAWALWRLTGWWLDRPRVKAFLFSAVRA